MPLRDDLLNPIPGDNPAGANLRYSRVYDEIRDARRQDDPGIAEKLSAGKGGEAKRADYKRVIQLAQTAVATQSKDLQLAAWLAEALTYQEQFSGLHQGLDLIFGLVESFWDNLYPELEDGDAEGRAAPLEWLGNYFDPARGSSPALAVRLVPLNQAGHTWIEYKQWQKGGPADQNPQLKEFEKAFAETPKNFYVTIDADLKAALESLRSLDNLCEAKFGSVAPSFGILRSALQEVGSSISSLLHQKLALEPDMAEPTGGRGASQDTEPRHQPSAPWSITAADAEHATGSDVDSFLGGELTSYADACRHVTAAARYLHRLNPSHPLPYLLLRALRWGELRAAANGQFSDLLEPPPAGLRMTMRRHAQATDWKRVLELSESAMCDGCGRGWLDLQRYTITACEELGYTAAAQALRSELKTLLSDFPQLMGATLLDDTGTANPDTLAWLRREGFAS
jgi:type VI secretion system protein ImpA